MRPFKNKCGGQNLSVNISCKEDKSQESQPKYTCKNLEPAEPPEVLLFLPLWSSFTGWKALECLFRVAHHRVGEWGETVPHPKLLGGSHQEERQVSEGLGPAEGIKLRQSPAEPESGPQGLVVESPLHMHIAQSEDILLTPWGTGTAASKSALFLRPFSFVSAGTLQVDMWSLS